MKSTFIPLFAMLSLGAAFAQDGADSLDAPPKSANAAEADKPAEPPVGRYQMTEAGNYQLMVDTATGRVWQVNRRGLDIAMTPVLYEHEDEVKTPLPEYTPKPKPDARAPQPVSPEVTAERVEAAEEFVNDTIHQPMLDYMSTLGDFPPGLANLAVNVQRDPRWQGPYLKQTVIDPWGNRYRYLRPGEHNPDTYDVWSLGPDGVESEDDIGNW